MGISSLMLRMRRALFPRLRMAEDAALDELIRDALLDEALAVPSAGAWERLLSAIEDGAARRQGMWVLEEVSQQHRQRARPEQHLARIERQVALARQGHVDHWWHLRDALWGNMFPTYAAWVNW